MFSAINYYSNQTLKRKKNITQNLLTSFQSHFTSSSSFHHIWPMSSFLAINTSSISELMCVCMCVLTTPPTTRTPIEVREVREARPVTMETISSSWVMELCGNGGMLVLTGVRAMVRGTCRENTAENSTEQSTKGTGSESCWQSCLYVKVFLDEKLKPELWLNAWQASKKDGKHWSQHRTNIYLLNKTTECNTGENEKGLFL